MLHTNLTLNMLKFDPRIQTSSIRGIPMTQLVDSASVPSFDEQRISPVILLATWLFLGLATYGYAMFKIWAPQLTQSLLMLT